VKFTVHRAIEYRVYEAVGDVEADDAVGALRAWAEQKGVPPQSYHIDLPREDGSQWLLIHRSYGRDHPHLAFHYVVYLSGDAHTASPPP
jgi:hypothetical protein